MTKMPQDLRKETLDLVNAGKPAEGTQVAALIAAWLKSLDDEDLADVSPASLAPVLVQGFTQAAKRTTEGCQIASLRYADGRGGEATALLILNDDMPYLVDSIVMALRRQRVVANGVLNAVLPVRRDAQTAPSLPCCEDGSRSNPTCWCCCPKNWMPQRWAELTGRIADGGARRRHREARPGGDEATA
jgi:NAD-specific glutamate dehydrogenase